MRYSLLRNYIFIIILLIVSFIEISLALTKAGNIISNTAVCSYEDQNGLPLKVYSNTIQVEVLPVFGIDITPDNQLLDGIPTENIEIPFILQNVGNTKDKYILNPKNLGGDSDDLQNLKLIIDTNQNGSFDVGEPEYNNVLPPEVNAGETLNLLVTGKIPESAQTGHIAVELDGYSKNDSTKKDLNNKATINITTDGTLKLNKSINNPNPKPSEEVKFNIDFKNLGTKTVKGTEILTDFDNDGTSETKNAVIVFDKIPQDLIYKSNSISCVPVGCIPVFKGLKDSYWKDSESEVKGNIKAVGMLLLDKGQGVLINGQRGKLEFSVKIKDFAPSKTVTNIAEGIYKNQNGRQDVKSNPVNIKIQKVVKVVVDDVDDNGSYTGNGTPSDPDDLTAIDHASSGIWVEFNNEIWNLGNTKDIINVELDRSKSKNLPSEYIIQFLNTDKTPIVDTNLDGKLDVGEIDPGSKKDLIVRVFIPDGNYDNILFAIKSTSSIDSNVFDYTFDEIKNVEAASVEVFTTIRTQISGGDTVKKEPLKEAKVIVYEYDDKNRIIRIKKFFTDKDGAIIYDENGDTYTLYNWMRDGYSYRMTTLGEYKNFPYYLTPIFRKAYFDSVNNQNEEKCWNEKGNEISCEANTVKVKIKVTGQNKKLLVIPLDPAGYVYDAVTLEKVDGACVTFYKCDTQDCNSYKAVNQSLLDLYPDGIHSQENPQLSGNKDKTGNPVGKSAGAFEFRFKDYKSKYDGWYFIQVTFDCDLPATDHTLKDKYQEVLLKNTLPVEKKNLLKKTEVWDPYSGDVYQGELFYIDASFPGAILLRIPLISNSVKPIEVEKQASVSTASVGDYIKWTIKIKNPNDTQHFYDVSIYDQLPREFKYKSDSSKMDGTKVSDPQVLSDGSLKWQLPILEPGEEKTLTFYTITTATLSQGTKKNVAFSTGWINPSHSAKVGSNTAIAEVKLIRGIFSDKAYIFGKVFIDDNDNRIQDKNEAGIKGVKIYMEDGRYAITDSEGKYHFDNVIPGTHVLKVDKTTIPENGKLKIINNRNSGDPDTAFADVFPGDLFKVNFRLVPDNPKVKLDVESEYQVIHTKYGKVSVERVVDSILEDPTSLKIIIVNSLYIKNDSKTPLYELNYVEDSPLKPGKGSVYLNNSPFEDPEIIGTKFKWIIPLIMPNSQVVLKWNSEVPEKDSKVQAELSFNIKPTGQPKKMNVKVPVVLTFVKPEVFNLTIYFDFGKYHLSDDAKKSLEKIAEFLRKKDYKKIYINLKSYTDAVRVVSSAVGYEKNIQLSKKRAKAVLDYLRSLLIDTKKVEIK